MRWWRTERANKGIRSFASYQTPRFGAMQAERGLFPRLYQNAVFEESLQRNIVARIDTGGAFFSPLSPFPAHSELPQAARRYVRSSLSSTSLLSSESLPLTTSIPSSFSSSPPSPSSISKRK